MGPSKSALRFAALIATGLVSAGLLVSGSPEYATFIALTAGGIDATSEWLKSRKEKRKERRKGKEKPPRS